VIAHGYSDMVTPYAVSRYILDHLPPSIEEQRAELRLYRGRPHVLYRPTVPSTSRKSLYCVGSSRPRVMSRYLLNIAKRSLLRLMLSYVGLASKHAAG
jgi:hypothetical protein